MFQINWLKSSDNVNAYSIDFFNSLDILFNERAKSKLTIHTLNSSLVYFLPIIWNVVNSKNYSLSEKEAIEIGRSVLKNENVKESNLYIGSLHYHIYEDEVDDKLKQVWEEFLGFELYHLQMAAELIKKHEKRDPEEVIGEKVVHPCHFTSQKDYVEKVLRAEIDKRLGSDKDYQFTKDIPQDWASYQVQETAGKDGSPSEVTIRVIAEQKKRDLVCASDNLKKDLPKLAKKAMQKKGMTSDTVTAEEYEKMSKEEFLL